MGELEVRGPWIASSYFNYPEAGDRWSDDGWFRTGDIVTMDGEGYVQITDRSKDVIKSGGEWISSVDLENAIMGHPAVKEAAVIALPHTKWDERPLACIVLKDGAALTKADLDRPPAQRLRQMAASGRHRGDRRSAEDLDRKIPETHPAQPLRRLAMGRGRADGGLTVAGLTKSARRKAATRRRRRCSPPATSRSGSSRSPATSPGRWGRISCCSAS